MNFTGYTAYLDGSLKLDRFGQWWHQGRPFQNEKLSDFFHRSIIWDPAGARYMLEIGAQRATFSCEDSAYFVLQLLDSNTPWQIALNDRSSEALRADSLSLGSENQIYCIVKSGAHRARFTRAAHQALLAHAIDEEHLRVDGKVVKLRSC